MILTEKSDCVIWNYGKLGPDVWGKLYPECSSHSQSPVNIQTACTIHQTFRPFNFTHLNNQSLSFTLKNDGHTITAQHNTGILSLNGGNLIGNYRFVNFHLHWGENENVGSEHQINGVKYMGESHFVYENIETGKLAVLGFLMESYSDSDDSTHKIDNATMNQWRYFFDIAQGLIKENASITIELNLSLLMGKNLFDFWRYNGSLTIPPCTESVIWTVFKQTIPIFSYNFDIFRGDLLFESYRGPQPLYHRQIYRSFTEEILSSVPDQNCCLNIKSKATLFSSLPLLTIFILYSFFFLSLI